eukprot:2888152-Rhodomonas_salina.1
MSHITEITITLFSLSFDLHVALIYVSLPRRKDMKIVELSVAHPHHALHIVNPMSEVKVVVILPSATVQCFENKKDTDYNQPNDRWIEVSELFIAVHAPSSLEL